MPVRQKIKPRKFFTINPKVEGATKAERVINWIQQLPVHQGRYRVGERVQLFEYQKQIVRGIFNEQKQIRIATISMARKMSKSSIAQFLLLAHCLMPELQRPSAQLFAISVTTNQAKLLFKGMMDIIDQLDWQTQEQCAIRSDYAQITIPSVGILFKVLAADKSGAKLQGYEPTFAVMDECGSFESVMEYQALKTANPRLLLLISTQSHLTNAETHWFTKLLHEPKLGDHHYRYFLGATREECKKWDDPEVWKRVTPAPEIKSLSYLQEEAEDAKRHGNINSFKVFHLNALVPSLSSELSIYTQEELDACWSPKKKIKPQSRVLIGVDLSQLHDLSVCLIHEIATGVTESFFFIPKQAVTEGTNYKQWEADGHCQIVTGKCVNFRDVAEKIKEYEQKYKVVAVLKDAWLANQYEIIAEEVGVKSKHISVKQQGREMGVATKHLQKLIKERNFFITNPILRWNFHCVKWSEDTYGNIRPHKQLSRAKASNNRIDGVVAVCNTCFWLAEEKHKPTKKKFTFKFL